LALAFGSAGHALLQAAQCSALVCRSTQDWPHATVPLGHELAHVPAAQTLPVGQTLPHAPQFFGSVLPLTQVLPHFRLSVPQSTSHLPALHTADPTVGIGHALPHAPQF
jgi:hypothetical protein